MLAVFMFTVCSINTLLSILSIFRVRKLAWVNGTVGLYPRQWAVTWNAGMFILLCWGATLFPCRLYSSFHLFMVSMNLWLVTTDFHISGLPIAPRDRGGKVLIRGHGFFLSCNLESEWNQQMIPSWAVVWAAMAGLFYLARSQVTCQRTSKTSDTPWGSLNSEHVQCLI